MLGFRKKYKTESEHLENESRRNFLKSAGKGALVAGLTGTGFLKPENALAYDLSNLPPGFQICKDQVLVNVYIMMLRGEHTKIDIIKGALIHNGKLGDVHTGFVDNSTPLVEPAYWFTVCNYNYKFQSNGLNGILSMDHGTNSFLENIKNNHKAMYNWSRGINMYFRTWINKDYNPSVTETETYLLRAIFTAAGRSEGEVEDYKKLDLVMKERYLQGVMQNLSKENYTNKLIAAWSSFFITDHFYRIEKKGVNTMLYYNEAEQKTKKILGHPIRGPPHYPGI